MKTGNVDISADEFDEPPIILRKPSEEQKDRARQNARAWGRDGDCGPISNLAWCHIWALEQIEELEAQLDACRKENLRLEDCLRRAITFFDDGKPHMALGFIVGVLMDLEERKT